ncbi:hypothetical protein Tco_0200624 [Tanacetum coccineum]
MSTPTFSNTHNMVAFLKKPAESDGFHEIIDFLNANQIHYDVNPTIYTPCIEQFWATAKIKTVNGERQLQALVDKKKVIIKETSIRSDLHLEDACGIDCLPNATIFEELARMGAKTTAWNEFSSTMASAIICLATNQKFNLSKYIFDAMLGDMSHHKKIYVNPTHTNKIFANMKREGKDFSVRVTPLFATMMVQANQEEGVDSGIPTASQRTPITILPYTSKPQKKHSRWKQKTTNTVPHPSDSTADVPNKESVPTHSNDPLISVKKLEKKAGLRTHKFKRLYKVAVTRRLEYSDDESLGTQEDASKQGRSIADIDKDAEVSLVDETQGRSNATEMFDTNAFTEVSTAAPSTTAVPPPDITEVEITLAQTLAKLKSVKSKVVIQEPIQSTTTTAPSTIPKAKGITFRDD